MKMTQSLIDDYEALSLNKLKELSEARVVQIKSNGFSREGKLTSPPYFKVAHILTVSNDANLASGSWWIDIDGEARSLNDFNVIPNKYNSHSMAVIS